MARQNVLPADIVVTFKHRIAAHFPFDIRGDRAGQRIAQPRLSGGLRALAPAGAGQNLAVTRVPQHEQADCGEIQQDGDDPRHDGGAEQVQHALLGQDGIDHHDDRRRDQRAKRAPARNRPGNQRIGIATAAHLGQGNLHHGRGRRHR